MEVKKNSVWAIYLTGIAWILMGFILPLYKLSSLIITLFISIGVYMLFSRILPKEVTYIEKDPFEMTKDEKVNELVKQANEYILTIRGLDNKIPNEEMSKKIQYIEMLTKKIFDYVIKNPENLPSIRRLVNYYLPTTIKLLNTYVTLSQQGVQSENISESMNKINNLLDTLCTAFEKQLDSLFANKAMDVSADITVFENILKSEGLLEDNNIKMK